MLCVSESLSRLTEHGTYVSGLLGPSLVTGAGLGLLFVPLPLVALARVGEGDSGVAASLLNVGRQVGGSIGLAVLGTVAWTVVADGARGQAAAARTASRQAAYQHALAAAPESPSPTRARATNGSGTNSRPSPAPVTRLGPSRPLTYVPCSVSRDSQYRPPAPAAPPASSSGRAPIRGTSAAAAPELANHQLGGRDDQQCRAEVAAVVPDPGLTDHRRCHSHATDAGGWTARRRPAQEVTSAWSAGMTRPLGVPRGE